MPKKISEDKHYINKGNGRRYAVSTRAGFKMLVTVDDRLPDSYPVEDVQEFPDDWEAVEVGAPDPAASSAELEELKQRCGQFSSDLEKKDRLVRFLKGDRSLLFDKNDEEVFDGDTLQFSGRIHRKAVVIDGQFYLHDKASGRTKGAWLSSVNKTATLCK